MSKFQPPTTMEKNPRLSIGIPVYNGENFLRELLTNLREQTFNDFEIVICDNASTDRTEQICREYAALDSRIRYHRNQTNIGANRNFNKVFELSTAPLFKWAAHDDLYDPTYLEVCVKILDENPDVIGAHAATSYINAWRQEFVLDPDSGLYRDPASGVQLPCDLMMGGERRFSFVRFMDVLFNTIYCHEVFGVFRRSVLERSRLLSPDFYGADKSLLLEVILFGRFLDSKERLYLKRYHKNMSAALSADEAKKWVNPEGRTYSRPWRLFLSYLTTPIGKPIGIFPKLICFALVCAYGLRFLPIVCLRSVGMLRVPENERMAALGRRPSSESQAEAPY
jgi:glycosyltransferase involved in cell wall biosynthesis